MGNIVQLGRPPGGRPPGFVDPSIAVGRSESVPLLDGDPGTVQTVRLIRRAVRESLVDPYVRASLAHILKGVPPHNDFAEARAIFGWVLHNIRFTKDPVDIESVKDAKWTLVHGIGDCDDINAVLLPALLMSAGHPVRLVTVSNQPSAPEAFSHIYAEVKIQGSWIPVDAARSGARFGKGPSRWFRKRVWSLTEDRYQDVGGLSGTRVELGGFADTLRTISESISSGIRAATEVFQTGPSFVSSRTEIPIPTAPPPAGTIEFAGREIPQNYFFIGLGVLALLMLRKK